MRLGHPVSIREYSADGEKQSAGVNGKGWLADTAIMFVLPAFPESG
jgi:hypothetical protein